MFKRKWFFLLGLFWDRMFSYSWLFGSSSYLVNKKEKIACLILSAFCIVEATFSALLSKYPSTPISGAYFGERHRTSGGR